MSAREHTAGPSGGEAYPNWSEAHSLPWFVEAGPDGFWICNENVDICFVPGYTHHPGNAANAAFIARAVNSHATMLAALKPFADFLDALEQMGAPFPKEGPVYHLQSAHAGERILTVEDFKAARSALATLTGTKGEAS